MNNKDLKQYLAALVDSYMRYKVAPGNSLTTAVYCVACEAIYSVSADGYPSMGLVLRLLCGRRSVGAMHLELECWGWRELGFTSGCDAVFKGSW